MPGQFCSFCENAGYLYYTCIVVGFLGVIWTAWKYRQSPSMILIARMIIAWASVALGAGLLMPGATPITNQGWDLVIEIAWRLPTDIAGIVIAGVMMTGMTLGSMGVLNDAFASLDP